MLNGTLISFEGPEGRKSSVLEAVLLYLKKRNCFITTVNQAGERPRSAKVILDPDHTSMDAQTGDCCFILLVAGSIWLGTSCRAAGKIVLMDRFIDSSVAYQIGRGHQCGRLSSGSINLRRMVFARSAATDVDVERARSNCQKPRAEVNRLDLEGLGFTKK